MLLLLDPFFFLRFVFFAFNYPEIVLMAASKMYSLYMSTHVSYLQDILDSEMMYEETEVWFGIYFWKPQHYERRNSRCS